MTKIEYFFHFPCEMNAWLLYTWYMNTVCILFETFLIMRRLKLCKLLKSTILFSWYLLLLSFRRNTLNKFNLNHGNPILLKRHTLTRTEKKWRERTWKMCPFAHFHEGNHVYLTEECDATHGYNQILVKVRKTGVAFQVTTIEEVLEPSRNNKYTSCWKWPNCVAIAYLFKCSRLKLI